MSTTLPYGSWPSPIDIELLTGGSIRLAAPRAAGGATYWLESRPQEKGRTVLVRRVDGATSEVTAAPFNVRSGVHEYGGGAYAVARDTPDAPDTPDTPNPASDTPDLVVFSHYGDGRLYVIDGAAEPRPITPDLPGRVLRYADLEIDLPRRRVLAVREDHRGVGEPGGPSEPVNTIVAVNLVAHDYDEGTVLVAGHDFVSSPRLSPDGEHLAWITWEHPSMPWDSSQLWSGDSSAGGAALVDGGGGVSVADVGWLSDGRLAWCSDRTGYQNLYVDGVNHYPVEADCAGPAWVFNSRGWTQAADGSLLVRRFDAAGARLVRLSDGAASELPLQLAAFGDLAPGAAGTVLGIAEFRDRPAALVDVDPTTGSATEICATISESVDAQYFSIAEPIQWQSPDGAQVYGYFYPPTNPEVQAPDGELPPLIVLSHGGPTAQSSPGLSLGMQYWTSRGFAILDVNYGGSTGHGRAYQDRLQGKWGVVDVDDCCSGAQYLVDQGRVDPQRLVIKGGSAGGYTTLAALTFRSVFAVGVSKYGIGDLAALATDTHKFEARYLDGLVGPYPAAKASYEQRSPIHHVDNLDCALLLLQGLDDRVVPPNQAESMADAVRAKGRPVALRMYEGEGHGFRMADTVRDATGAELAFYSRVFGFTSPDELPDIDIDNLPGPAA